MIEAISRFFRNWKLVEIKKLLYLPRILNAKEKSLLLSLLIVAFSSGAFLATRLYLQFTIPVPSASGVYSEGILGEPRAINPIFASRDSERDISRLMYSGLLVYDGKGNIAGDLAEKYEVSEDGKTYTVILRDGMRWHDNALLTADDVAFTVHTIQNAQYKSPLRPNWQGVTVEVIDPRTMRFILRVSYAPFIENLTIGILPKHLWGKIPPEQALLHELNLKPVGSGPYKFSDLRQEKDGTISQYRVTANLQYYREGPYLEEITFIFFHSEDDMIAAARTGRIDGYGPVSEKLASNINKSTSQIENIEMPRIFGLFFNDQKHSALEDQAVREALSYLLNREEIAKSVTSGHAIPFGYPLPGFLRLHKKNVPDNAYNVEHAKEILDKAYWTDDDHNGIRERISRSPKTKQLETRELKFILSTSDWPDLVKAAETIKNELHPLGIEITIEPHPFSKLEPEIIRPRNFEMLLFGQVYGFEPDPFPFWHSSQIKDPGLNIASYANKKADKALEEARKTSDLETRKELYRQFEDEVMQDYPAIFLYSQTFLYLLPQNLQGVTLEKISLPSDRFNEINRWYRKTKRVFR